MANVDNPHGLRPLMRTLDGGLPLIEEYNKLATFGTAIFRNDGVARVASGDLETGVSITPGTTFYSGVALNYGALSTLTKHQVVTSPGAIYEAQADGSLLVADMGLNANLIMGAGSTTTQISGHEINSATENTTATLDVHMLQKLNVPDNEAGAYMRIECVFNNHRLMTQAAGV